MKKIIIAIFRYTFNLERQRESVYVERRKNDVQRVEGNAEDVKSERIFNFFKI